MKKGSTRHCAKTACRKPFVVEAGDFFITCPGCRLPWVGSDLGARQLLPHARERKLVHDDGGYSLQLAGGEGG